MEGGIRAWTGLTAEGPPEAAVAYFPPGTIPADMTSLAWALEEATRRFYTELAGRNPGSSESGLYSSLTQAEEHHKETLANLHGNLTSEPVSRMFDRQEPKILEGGMELEAALQWTEGKQVTETLELVLGLETNAYDRYLKMLDIAEDETSKGVFRGIAREEKNHLKRLADLMDEELKRDKR